MKSIEISATLRNDFGKKGSQAIRKTDSVPCVLYGQGENLHFAVTNDALRNLVYSPDIYLVNIPSYEENRLLL